MSNAGVCKDTSTRTGSSSPALGAENSSGHRRGDRDVRGAWEGRRVAWAVLEEGKAHNIQEKYQKVIVVVKKAERYICKSLAGRVKAGACFS